MSRKKVLVTAGSSSRAKSEQKAVVIEWHVKLSLSIHRGTDEHLAALGIAEDAEIRERHGIPVNNDR